MKPSLRKNETGTEFRGEIRGGSDPLVGAEVALYVDLISGQPSEIRGRCGSDGSFSLECPRGATAYALLVTPRAGFWQMLISQPEDGLQVVCPPLPRPPESDWWHRALGVPSEVPDRGEGIRIGVIDTGCGPHPSLDHVRSPGRFLKGGFDTQARQDAREHGTHVCGILGMRPSRAGDYAGIAPGASIYCVGVLEEATEKGANQVDIANAIELLSRDFQADLINISLGCSTKSVVLEEAVLDALERGTLCVCAAGNSGGSAGFPAALDATVGVSAVGKIDWGPPESLAAARSRAATHSRGEGYYLPDFSAYGETVLCAGPGVGITSAVPTFEGEGLFRERDGTSMAGPAVCGALAVTLSRSQSFLKQERGPRRAELAREVLRAICVDIGLPAEFRSLGMPRIPRGIF